jgi:peptidoglycan DL-endopeptidase CwlO
MKRNRAFFLVALVTLLTLPLVLPSPSSAETLAQKRARAHDIMKQLTVLDIRMEKVVEAYDAATGKLDAVKAHIKQNERDLALARYSLQVAQDTLRQRVVSMYKQRPVELLDVVLATNSFSSLVDQLQLIDRVGQNDASVVSSIDHYKGTIIKTQKALQVDRTAAVKLVAERSVQKSQVEQQLSQRKAMLRGVKAEIDAMQAAQNRAAAKAAQGSSGAGGGGTGSGAAPGPVTGGVVGYAASFLGVPYVWGGSSPAGFDCSGFTMYVYSHFGVGLPHNAAMQQSSVAAVPAGQEQAGDLVFFGNPAHHVGIYVGGGSMIHAPHTGDVVSYGSVAGNSGFGRP